MIGVIICDFAIIFWRFGYYGKHDNIPSKQWKKLIMFKLISNIIWAIHYFTLGAHAAFTGAAAKGILIATKHDSKGNMTAVQFDGVTAKSAGYYTIDFDDTFKAAEGAVTAMLWDGIDTMKPLCASVSK